MTGQLKHNISQKTANFVILEESENNNQNIKKSIVAFAYTHKNRRELLFAKYVSGPYDCAGVQCTMVVPNKTTESEILKKIKEFIEENTSLINF